MLQVFHQLIYLVSFNKLDINKNIEVYEMKGKTKWITLLIGIILFLPASSLATTINAPTNVIVNVYYTTLSSNLRSGDSVIMNLMLENTGDYNAKNVEVWIPDTANMKIDKKINVGNIEAGETRTIAVWIDVNEKADTGLTSIQVYINFDGYDSDGDPFHNKETRWEMPVVIYGEPLFQVTSEKTTYYMDSLDKLILEGYTATSVKDMEATLSSRCMTVIGSSKKYIGDIEARQKFDIIYDIKSSTTGACSISLMLSYIDESGSRVTENVSLGLIVEDAGIDFKIVEIGYESAGPGEKVNLKLSLKNVGETDAEDTTLSLSLSDPFTTADTSEKYIGKVAANETIDAEFNLAVSWDSEAQVYTIPLTIEYKVGGTSYTAEKNVGIDVGGKVILEVINVESSGSSLRIDVANLGTRIAEGVKATLITGADTQVLSSDSTEQTSQFTGGRPGGGLGFIPGMRQRPTQISDEDREQMIRDFGNQTGAGQQYVDYKSDIKASKQTTFTFNTAISGSATLILEYNGPNNERVTQIERVTVGSGSGISSFRTSTGTRSTRGGTDYVGLLLQVIAALMVLYLLYKAYGKWKTEEAGLWEVKGYAAAALIIVLIAYMALYLIALLALVFLAYKAYNRMKSG